MLEATQATSEETRLPAQLKVLITAEAPGQYATDIESDGTSIQDGVAMCRILRGVADDLYGSLVESLGAKTAFQLVHQPETLR